VSKAGLLPRRWRQNSQAAHLEAIAHVLDTPPVTPTGQGPLIAAEFATADVLPLLVAAKSLWRRLGRGRFLLCADRSVTGADRAILAHHLGDPDFASAAGQGFPQGLPWNAVAAAMARRRGDYCFVLSTSLVATGPLPEVEAAIAANRSLFRAQAAGDLLGFAAGGPALPDAQRFAAVLGDDRSAGAQQAALMAREIAPVALGTGAALEGGGGEALIAARRAAIAAFG